MEDKPSSPGAAATARERLLGAAWSVVASVKNALVSAKPRYLKVLFGPAKGAILHTSYRVGSRMIFGAYEIEVAPYLRRYVRAGDCCYDVGSAAGYYAFALARLAAPGDIYSFDIDEGAARELQTLASLNSHLGSTVHAYRLRVGANSSDEAHTSLDALVYERQWKRPDVIKLDVEGDEFLILMGADRLLREHRPRLIIEVHSQSLEDECQRLLDSIGYKTTVVHNQAMTAESAFRHGLNRWLCAE